MTNLKRNRANDRNVRTAHLHLGSGVLVSCYRSRNPNGDSERCDVRAVATARQRGLQLHCTWQGVVHSVQARLQRPPIRLVPHIPALLTALKNLQHLTGGELRLLLIKPAINTVFKILLFGLFLLFLVSTIWEFRREGIVKVINNYLITFKYDYS